MNLFIAEGYKGMELRQLNRCRLMLKAMFLSDITTANGRRLESFVFQSRIGRESRFQFPRECPSLKDWKLWDEFWTCWCLPNGTVPAPLREWLTVSHQQWQWYYEAENDRLWERENDIWVEYTRVQTGRSTCRNMLFTPINTWTIRDDCGRPASVHRVESTVQIINTGPTLAQPQPPTTTTFWEFVLDQGGEWIWDYIEGRHDDMSWIATALYDGSAVMVTDGSYNRNLAPTVSGAGWVLVSTNSLRMVYGSFVEISEAASSYRGELLGLTAIHHLVSFVLEFYVVQKARGSIHCDNKGALHQASTKRKRVRPRTKHADLIRNLRHIKASHSFEVVYMHVKAHLDDHFAWNELTVIQQLNVHCDHLAKQAVQDWISHPSTRHSIDQLLPREQAAVFVVGGKQTSDTAAAIRFELGKIEARRFFTRPVRIKNNTNMGGLGWQGRRFDCIDWNTLDAVLASKPMTYRVWLAKQTIGVCGTRCNVARYQGLNDDRCPNCLVGPERSTHLNLCLEDGRSLLFREAVTELEDWMGKMEQTDAELRYFLAKFLHFRGERSMCSLGQMSVAVREVAEDIDLIGRVDILHGRIPNSLRQFQQGYCATINSRMNGADWAKAFVTKLLDISHGQWTYRNFSLHNKVKGHLALTEQAEVLSEIATLACSRLEDIPPNSRFHVKLEVGRLDAQSLAQQKYWISAMKAALKAGRRCSPMNRCHGNRTRIDTKTPTLTSSQRRNLHLFRRRIESLERDLREELDLDCSSWRTKRPRQLPNDSGNGSNKRLRKPD